MLPMPPPLFKLFNNANTVDSQNGWASQHIERQSTAPPPSLPAPPQPGDLPHGPPLGVLQASPLLMVELIKY